MSCRSCFLLEVLEPSCRSLKLSFLQLTLKEVLLMADVLPDGVGHADAGVDLPLDLPVDG
jgi:hypothetical protein